MWEYGLGRQATHDEALDNVTLDPGVTQLDICHVQLRARLDPRPREEEVIQTNDWDNGGGLSAMLKAHPTSQITPAAPRPVGHMSPGTMLLHLLLGRLTKVNGHLDMLGLLVELILDLDLLVVANLLAGGA